MSTEIARLDLRLRRCSIYGCTAGIALYAFVVVALYPSFRNDTSLDKLTEHGSAVAALFGASGPLTTAPGWLNANLYSNFVPLIVLLLTIGYGASSLAGQDEDGTLGLIATLPLSRGNIAAQKAATMIVQAVPVVLVTLLCVLIGRSFDLAPSAAGVIGVSMGALLLGIDFGAIAMLVGAATGSRGTALGITSALAAASYLIGSLAPTVSWLHPARYASLFFYAVADGQISHGLPPGWAGILVGVAALAIAACLPAFARLDVR